MLELDRAAAARHQQTRRHAFGTAAEIDHDLAADVAPLVIILIAIRKTEAVPDELRGGGDGLLASLVLREGHAFAVLERLRLAVHRDRDARVARCVDAQHLHDLKVAPIVTRGLHAPFLQVVRDVGSREAEPFFINTASLQLIRCDVRQPFLELVWCDGRADARRGDRCGRLRLRRARRVEPQRQRQRCRGRRGNRARNHERILRMGYTPEDREMLTPPSDFRRKSACPHRSSTGSTSAS